MITADKDVECQLHLSYAETEATTWSLTDVDHAMNWQQRKIKGITSKMQMQCKLEFTIG